MTGSDLALLARAAVHLRPSQIAQCARLRAQHQARGVQEETTVLGVPCLTLRDSSERPITLTEGTNQLVGRDPDRIVKAARAVLAAPLPRPGKPSLWDGQAGRRIASALVAGHDARNQ